MAAKVTVEESLHRELGLWDALAIGAGTMIGAGIFLLAGVALELTGPAAVFAYLGAGLVCIMTAASAAEMATGMPTSGGDYYFVSRSLGPAFGAVSGVGIWLSLTFAIAFYLFGLGEYLAQFTPLTPFWGAALGGVLLTALNVIGAKESGRTQVVIVLILLGILGIFSLTGLFYLDLDNFTPFFPFGNAPIFSTTALVFISFLGFVKIAAVAEEIKDPARNLPRALIGSVAIVTLLYVLILLVIAGVFSQATIGAVRDPLTAAARLFFGPVGGILMIFAGLLATMSSANASIMAASRINLAMARDRMIPNWFSQIHGKLLTPHRAIVVTGILALLFLSIDSLEELAKIASVLQLYSYAALNVGCAVLRAAKPDWYRPTYRTPGYPFIQIFAAVACIGIILYSGFFAQLAIVVLITVSLVWYLSWGRGRISITHAVPYLKTQWEEMGLRAFFMPAEKFAAIGEEEVVIPMRVSETKLPRRVMVALANPKYEADLLRLGRYIATGTETPGRVFGLHLVKVPLQTPLTVAREHFEERQAIEQSITNLDQEALQKEEREHGARVVERPVEETAVEVVTDVAHDVFGGLVVKTAEYRADLLLMGWQGGFNVSRIYETPVQRIMSNVLADLAVFKNRDLNGIDSILLPWGGGIHARMGLEIAVRIARATQADIHILRVVRPEVDARREERALLRSIETLIGDYPHVHYHIQRHDNVTDGIMQRLDADKHDLVIIGASRESKIRRVLFGTIPDRIADRADCSVLMVRRYLPDHWSVKVAERVKVAKEGLGLSTSPREENSL